MNKIIVFFLSFIWTQGISQVKNIDKATLDKTYSYTAIHKSIRDIVDAADKSAYFNDDFFNIQLKKIITNKAFTEKEKVQMFFLMQKKIGFSFVGAEYLPPKQNYFVYHIAKIYTYQKTKLSLKDLNYNVASLLTLVDSNRTKDVVVSANALLLAALLNSDSTVKKIARCTRPEMVMESANPGIFNHYVCLSASILQNPEVVSNLKGNLVSFTDGGFIEDVLCALYAKNNNITTIKEYVLNEKKSTNSLAVQTALCVLANKLPEASFKLNVKRLAEESKEKWKADLCREILNKKIPFNYKLTSKDLLITKAWKDVVLTQYNNGTLIKYGSVMEFDPN